MDDLKVVAFELWLAWADLVLGVEPNRRWRLRLGGPFTFVDATKSVTEIETIDDSWSALAPLLALRGAEVLQATARADGHLTIDFSDMRRLDAAPDPEFEAWHIMGPDLQILCGPGGEVHVWGQL